MNTPSQEYRDITGEVSKIQVYKAGIRLADILNAIYDPDNALPAYKDYVKNLDCQTLDELCHVKIELWPSST